MKKSILAVVVALLLQTPTEAGLITFSIDPASPAIDGIITPDDVLLPGLGVGIAGTDLGLLDDFAGGVFDNLNALSYGRDAIRNPLLFSVDRVAIGLPGSAVDVESFPGAEAAGDVFRALPPSGSNVQVTDEEELGLTPGFFGDDLDALALLHSGPIDFIYFSIDDLSASVGGGVSSGDILVSDGGGSFGVFADTGDIGLDEFDDLDALVLLDRGTIGVVDPGLDIALFSLSTFSPSTFTGGFGAFSPADVLVTDFTGGFGLWAAAADLGLRDDDELNALTTVPEPASLLGWSLGIVCILGWRIRRRQSSRSA